MDQFDALFYETFGTFNGQSNMLAFLGSLGVSDDTLNSMHKQLITAHVALAQSNLKASQENAANAEKMQSQAK